MLVSLCSFDCFLILLFSIKKETKAKTKSGEWQGNKQTQTAQISPSGTSSKIGTLVAIEWFGHIGIPWIVEHLDNIGFYSFNLHRSIAIKKINLHFSCYYMGRRPDYRNSTYNSIWYSCALCAHLLLIEQININFY